MRGHLLTVLPALCLGLVLASPSLAQEDAPAADTPAADTPAAETPAAEAPAPDGAGDPALEPAGGTPEAEVTPPTDSDVDPDAVGVMVRVTSAEGEADPVAVELTPADGGEAVEIEVVDDGTGGDVDAGDRTWAGSRWLKGDSFAVVIQTADGPVDAGTVSWDPDDESRDLVVRIDADQVSAEALVATPVPAQPGAAGAAGAVSTTVPPGAPPVGGDEGDGGMLRIAGLVFGLLALGALLWWWRQSGQDGADDLLGDPLDEPGLLGAGTPAISGGVSVFTVSAADAPDLARALLGAVARDRAVVTSTPSTFSLPAVHGGPVYPLMEHEPEAIGEALAWFSAKGARAVAFVVASKPSVETIAGLDAARAAGTGVVLLAIDGGDGLPGAVACSRVDGGWKIGGVTAAEGPYGLVHPGLSRA